MLRFAKTNVCETKNATKSTSWKMGFFWQIELMNIVEFWKTSNRRVLQQEEWCNMLLFEYWSFGDMRKGDQWKRINQLAITQNILPIKLVLLFRWWMRVRALILLLKLLEWREWRFIAGRRNTRCLVKNFKRCKRSGVVIAVRSFESWIGSGF